MGLDYVFSLLDDDGVFSKSREQHWTHLHKLFAILAANGLALKLEKCMFAVILDFPKPADCKALQRFLGMMNFYRRFLPSVPGTLCPLTALLSGNPKVLPWTPDMETAFVTARAALVTGCPWPTPSPGPFSPWLLTPLTPTSEQSYNNR
jgi:putative transposase